MPCRTDDFPDALEAPAPDYKKECDKLTSLLCSLCGSVPEEGMPKSVQRWWKKHKDQDRQRIQRDIDAARRNLKVQHTLAAQRNNDVIEAQKALDDLLAEQKKILNRK